MNNKDITIEQATSRLRQETKEEGELIKDLKLILNNRSSSNSTVDGSTAEYLIKCGYRKIF